MSPQPARGPDPPGPNDERRTRDDPPLASGDPTPALVPSLNRLRANSPCVYETKTRPTHVVVGAHQQAPRSSSTRQHGKPAARPPLSPASLLSAATTASVARQTSIGVPQECSRRWQMTAPIERAKPADSLCMPCQQGKEHRRGFFTQPDDHIRLMVCVAPQALLIHAHTSDSFAHPALLPARSSLYGESCASILAKTSVFTFSSSSGSASSTPLTCCVERRFGGRESQGKLGVGCAQA